MKKIIRGVRTIITRDCYTMNNLIRLSDPFQGGHALRAFLGIGWNIRKD